MHLNEKELAVFETPLDQAFLIKDVFLTCFLAHCGNTLFFYLSFSWLQTKKSLAGYVANCSLFLFQNCWGTHSDVRTPTFNFVFDIFFVCWERTKCLHELWCVVATI